MSIRRILTALALVALAAIAGNTASSSPDVYHDMGAPALTTVQAEAFTPPYAAPDLDM
jgi:hypothetical protein